MHLRDTLSAVFASPRDDEPPDLRQDIIDELADHLACAHRRELLRGADANAARARTLEQFGDPAAVARRLWFDAMKGKIMHQRFWMAACFFFLMIIVCGGALALWRHQREEVQRKLAEAQAQFLRAQAQSQSANQGVPK